MIGTNLDTNCQIVFLHRLKVKRLVDSHVRVHHTIALVFLNEEHLLLVPLF